MAVSFAQNPTKSGVSPMGRGIQPAHHILHGPEVPQPVPRSQSNQLRRLPAPKTLNAFFSETRGRRTNPSESGDHSSSRSAAKTVHSVSVGPQTHAKLDRGSTIGV